MRALTVALLLALTTHPSRAQQLDSVCNATLLATAPDDSAPAHPALRFPRALAAIDNGGAGAFLTTLRAELAAGLPASSDLRAPFLNQLDSAIADARAAATDTLAARRALAARFRGDAEDAGYRFFTRSSDRVVVTSAHPPVESRLACWTARLAQLTLSRLMIPALRAVADELAKEEAAWVRWEEEGWSLYPWESLANALPGIRRCASPGWGPPRCTLALGHAALGMVFNGPTGPSSGVSDWRSREEVVWDVIGIRTYARTGAPKLGLVIVGVAPAEESPRLGVAVSFGRALQAGWLPSRRSGTGAGRTGVVLSLDAYRLLAGVPAWVEQKRSRLRAEADRVLNEVAAITRD